VKMTVQWDLLKIMREKWCDVFPIGLRGKMCEKITVGAIIGYCIQCMHRLLYLMYDSWVNIYRQPSK
jgi:hypothetical protein